MGIQSATAIKDFFSGEWLEWFALGKILTEAGQKGDKYVFSCARRIKIQFSNEDKHELDAMILPEGGTPVVIECKSGEFRRDIKKYILLKKKLNLPRNHFIRLLRFGAELVFAICEAKNVEVVILNQGEDTTFEEDLARDVLEIITVFSARLLSAYA